MASKQLCLWLFFLPEHCGRRQQGAAEASKACAEAWEQLAPTRPSSGRRAGDPGCRGRACVRDTARAQAATGSALCPPAPLLGRLQFKPEIRGPRKLQG